MKALLISLFWICGSMGLKAQSYDPFPTSNAVWHALGFQYPFDMDEDYYHEMYSQKLFIDGDTLIGEQTWNKIYFSNQYLGNVEYRDNANYIAAIRENEHKQILAQFPDYPEFVLYDFSLDVGDTIYYDYAAAAGVSGTTPIALYRLDSPHYKVVVGKDSVQLETGEYRNQLILHSFLENYGNIHADNYWVEGLGCTNWTGLFNPLVVFFADNGDHLRFACFLHHEEVVYLDNPFCEDCLCETFTSYTPMNAPDQRFSVYPNPGTGNFTINLPVDYSQNLTLIITDIFGRILAEKQTGNSRQVPVNLNEYSRGIYIIQLWDKQHNILWGSEKIIMK